MIAIHGWTLIMNRKLMYVFGAPVRGAVRRWQKVSKIWLEEDMSFHQFISFTVMFQQDDGELVDVGSLEDLVREDTTLDHLRYLISTIVDIPPLDGDYAFKTRTGTKVCITEQIQ